MFKAIAARRATRQARRQYELAIIEGLIRENQRRLDDLNAADECRWCAKMDKSA